MSDEISPSQRITEEVLSWKDVTAGFGPFGEFAFRVNGREIGHLHGDTVAHFFFDRRTWAELKADGRIDPHPVFPGRQGPAARRIVDEEDAEDVIALMRLNYNAAIERHRTKRDAVAG